MPLPRLVLRVITAIQLTRLTMAFGAVGDLWFVVIVSRAEAARWPGDPGPLAAQLPLGTALLAALVVALGLFAFGAALNDLLDVRHDSAFSPERPIPAGRIRVGQAAVMTVGALLAALVAATAFGDGALRLAALTAAALLFYNAAGKFIPAIGLITVAAIHALHMLIPDVGLAFTLPVWLIATHTMAIAAVVHRLEEKRPPITRRSATVALLGYASGSALLLWMGAARGGLAPAELAPAELAWPLAAVVGFVIVARHKIAGVPGRVAAEKLRRYGAMWQALYGAAWLLALGLHQAALLLGLFALAGFIAMTLIKEINGLTGRPVEWRG